MPLAGRFLQQAQRSAFLNLILHICKTGTTSWQEAGVSHTTEDLINWWGPPASNLSSFFKMNIPLYLAAAHLETYPKTVIKSGAKLSYENDHYLIIIAKTGNHHNHSDRNLAEYF